MPYNDDTDLAKMGLGQLEEMRKGASQASQDLIAPYAHRAFARDVAKDNLPGAAAMAVAGIPGYTVGKYAAQNPSPIIRNSPIGAVARALGLTKSRSRASMKEMQQAYIGLGEGLKQRLFK